MKTIERRIADEQNVRENQIIAAVKLLDEGATVPFISRYRKEVTGGLTDEHLRYVQERLAYLRELEDRRAKVVEAIREQGKLTAELERELLEAETAARLEDLYLPYKPKRRTKAMIAREAGLEPLALELLADPRLDPERAAEPYVNAEKGVEDASAALDGAQYILIDTFGEDAELVGKLRDALWEKGLLNSAVAKGKEAEGAKFSDYFAYVEPLRKIPSHRALAVFRGEKEEVLKLSISHELDDQAFDGWDSYCEYIIARRFNVKKVGRAADAWLCETVHLSWQKKIKPHLETDLTNRLREFAHEEAIKVFSKNLKNLLLAAPAGERAVIGLDPGLRTGVKVAVVDATGKVLDTCAVYPHQPHNKREESIAKLLGMARKYNARLFSVGNGTASRETVSLVEEMRKQAPELQITCAVVNEAGASVYSASEYAQSELPGMDVSLRGAVSIARRLQDPMAELVKIDPKSIGVGQYQHDVDENRLAMALDAVVEDAVNSVGVDVNTASPALLRRVSGLNETLARNVVARREELGQFKNRKELLSVARFGPKTFEMAAGFLRIRGGDNPLDASAVHPESYAVVERILKKCSCTISQLIGNTSFLQKLNPSDFTDDKFGLPTVKDILRELEKPGRDPRPAFVTASFREGVETIDDLIPGMKLEGTVTNVTNFGAFVDVGVHQDGLVHISELCNRFVKDPYEVVSVGMLVKTVVLSVDKPRKRIALSIKQAGN